MKYLTPEHWESFKLKDQRYDGVKFEVLTGELLNLLGLSHLNQTQQSWDRSRDFQDESEKVWAECKIYKGAISIRAISPTLVMAIIDEPSTIYFFSYSPLNSNTIRHLSQFQDQVGLKILVFDDLVLEALILSSGEITKHYFPDFDYNHVPPEIQFNLNLNFSKDPEIEYHGELIEDPRNKSLFIYSVFSIDLFIRNLSFISNLNGDLEVQQNDKQNGLLLLNRGVRDSNYKINIDIDRGSLFYHRFYFKTLNCGRLKLPSFIFNSEILEERKVYKLNPNTISVSAVVQTVLIGAQYENALKLFKENIQARNQPVIFNVYGESGTGKSRLLKEYSEALFEEEFQVLKFNGEDVREVKFSLFIKKVFSRIFKLPILIDEEHKLKDDLITNILYNENFLHEEHIEKCADELISGIQNQKIAFQIDNLQNFDSETISFIDTLITKVEGIPLRLVFACCFNTNFVFDDTAASTLLSRLKLKTDNHTFFNEEIIGFNDGAFDTYLDHCITPINTVNHEKFSQIYPETTELFKEHVLSRPLFIEQTLLFLEQNEAIKRLNNKFIVNDISIFHNLLKNSFPEDLGELLGKRWNLFLEKIDTEDSKVSKDSIERILKFLCYFNKVGLSHLLLFNLSGETLDFLEKSGFIKIDEKDVVSFYHHQLFLFFRKQSGRYTTEELDNYRRFLIDNCLNDDFFYQYFILSQKLNRINDDLLIKAVDETLTNFQYEDFLIPFTLSLFSVLKKSKTKIEGSRMLLALRRMGRIVKVFDNLENGQLFLDNIIGFISKNRIFYKEQGLEYIGLVHESVNACIGVYKDAEAQLLLDDSFSRTDDFNYGSDQKKRRSIAQLRNRQCVVYKALGLNKDAINSGNQSLETAIDIQDHILELKNYIDLANVYGRKIENKETILSYWTKAVKVYSSLEKEDQAMSLKRPMVQLYHSQIFILTNDLQQGLDFLRDGFKFSVARSRFFFAVKYLLIEVVARITYQNSENNYQDLLLLLNKAKDFCVTYKVNRTYWKTFYIEAVLELRQNEENVETASNLFLMSLEQFQKVVKNVGIEEYNTNYLLNLTYFFRRNAHLSNLDEFLRKTNKLKSPTIINKINTVMNLDENEFNSLYNSHQPTELFNDGKFDFPVLG